MELLRINYESEQPTVSARELHEGLEINTKFATWFERMCEYGFSEGNEFFPKVGKTSEQGGRPSIDYQISIDMAKQICMIQRTDKGKQYRQYFIDLEKAWNTPEQVMARALKIANNEIDKLKAENKVLMSIIGDQTQRTDLNGGFRKKLARRICQMADLKIRVMKSWLGLECLSHTERKCMNLREILPHLSGEMSKDTELLKETAKQGDIVVLNVKMPDGTPTTVSAAIKAKYPHVVHMQYQTANGYTVNKTLAWKKLLMIMLNPSSIEDNEEGE